MLVDSWSVATVMKTKLIGHVINNLIKENDSLKGQLDTASKHENETQNVKKEFEETSRMTNDHLSRAHQTIEIAKYVSKVEEPERAISNLHSTIFYLKSILISKSSEEHINTYKIWSIYLTLA